MTAETGNGSDPISDPDDNQGTETPPGGGSDLVIPDDPETPDDPSAPSEP